jgi:hypothetical protein
MADFLLSHTTPARNNQVGALGCRFTVNTPILISQMGRFYAAANNQNHQVTLWNVSGPTQLAQGTIDHLSASDGNGYKWVVLSTPVLVVPGQTYAVAVDEANAGDVWCDQFTPTVDSHFTVTQAFWIATPGAFPTNPGTGGMTYSTPNFEDVSQFGLQRGDTLTMSDVRGLGDGLVLPADAMSMNDALAQLVNAALTLSDTLSLSDALLLSGALSKVITDTLIASDALGIGRGLSVADTLTLTDQLKMFSPLSEVLSDNLNFWADSVGEIGTSILARVSQVVLEAMGTTAAPRAIVTQVLMELMLPRGLVGAQKQPKITIST